MLWGSNALYQTSYSNWFGVVWITHYSQNLEKYFLIMFYFDIGYMCLALLLNVYSENGMTSGRLVIHVCRGRCPIKGSLFQSLHRLVLRCDCPRGHTNLKGNKNIVMKNKSSHIVFIVISLLNNNITNSNNQIQRRLHIYYLINWIDSVICYVNMNPFIYNSNREKSENLSKSMCKCNDKS